jgi:hypothetical protein
LSSSRLGSTGGCSTTPSRTSTFSQGLHLLLLLRRGWVGAAGVLLSLHTTGVLRAPAATPVAALPRSGGDLRPLL